MRKWIWRIRVALARLLLYRSETHCVTLSQPTRLVEETAERLHAYVERSGGLRSPHRIRAYTRIRRWTREMLDNARVMEALSGDDVAKGTQ